MSGRLTLKGNPLVCVLIDEMSDALEAMEMGDYDGAYQLLEQRCRPSEPMLAPPKTYSLESARAAKQLIDASPRGVLRKDHDIFVGFAADVVARVLTPPLSSLDVNTVCVAMNTAAECGIELEWSEIERDEQSDQHDPIDRLAGCRKGGRSSGKTRRREGMLPMVIKAIENCRKRGYERDDASKIANYVGVSPRYVRQVARELAEIKAEVN
jgi:hypothetical protein